MTYLLIKPFKLPKEILNIIDNFNYGPCDLITSKKKKDLNMEFLKADIWLHIIDSYKNIPELYFLDQNIDVNENIDNFLYDYIFAKRIPKLIF